jgi:hypothetical protein
MAINQTHNPSYIGTSFDILADGVIDKFRSSGIQNITEELYKDQILAHLRAAVVKFKASKQNLGFRDNELGYFNIDLTEEEIEILICFLAIEYLSANYINVPSLLRKQLTAKDFHVFSNRNHLEGLIHLRDTYKREVRQMVSIYSNQGSDLFNILINKRGRQPSQTAPENPDIPDGGAP